MLLCSILHAHESDSMLASALAEATSSIPSLTHTFLLLLHNLLLSNLLAKSSATPLWI